MNNNPVISIVTIVYNGIDTLQKTIDSIACQSYPHIEYIVIDGASNDGTVSLIEANQSSISKWISEPDGGLYDAMNKGLNLTTGDYVWFINSGDEIYASDTVQSMVDAWGGNWPDVAYGDTLLIDINGNEIGERRLQPPANLTWKSFKNGMLVSHQSILVSTKIASQYNTSYRFSADFEWCLRALKDAKYVQNTNMVLSRFLEGGLTKQNIVPGLKERFDIMRRYFGLIPTSLRHVPISLRFSWYVIKNKRF
ncbi:glycosyltransferase family 2 protein [Carboxylicivirga sp. M1479]|uniref:glycosyltransferase family 2 protein n=1 Tax=Carboxylicivirga sp. M1479 TaxID=2594476 RepID=UPI001177C1DE|nr:glycosyltransferase family 2 protein [Carboxylicivirga sp. M1479]TRX71694.1 glycosyltransferase [Carboxylicivirga sp. M1479]